MRSKLEWRAARVVSIETPAEDVRAVTFAVEGLRSAFDPGRIPTSRSSFAVSRPSGPTR